MGSIACGHQGGPLTTLLSFGLLFRPAERPRHPHGQVQAAAERCRRVRLPSLPSPACFRSSSSHPAVLAEPLAATCLCRTAGAAGPAHAAAATGSGAASDPIAEAMRMLQFGESGAGGAGAGATQADMMQQMLQSPMTQVGGLAGWQRKRCQWACAERVAGITCCRGSMLLPSCCLQGSDTAHHLLSVMPLNVLLRSTPAAAGAAAQPGAHADDA